MSDYKRLTKRLSKNYAVIWCEQCPVAEECENNNLCEKAAIDRLAELENKIENGTLIELPCKVGDTIFFVYDFGSEVGECVDYDKGIVDGISHQVEGIWIHARYEGGLTYWHKEDDIGTKVFLTKAEAEAKLEQIRKGEV